MTDDRSDFAGADEEPEAQAPEAQAPEAQAPAAQAPAAQPSDPRVAAAVDRLNELGAKDPADHVEIYEQVHRDLQDALAEAADQRTTSVADDGQSLGDDADQRTASTAEADRPSTEGR